MLAFQLVDRRQPPELREVPVPEPGPGQILLKVAGAGACHSDLHIMRAPAPLPGFPNPPFTLGHENAGRVERLGPGVSGVQPGDPVIVYGSWGCGICANCRQGQENYCQNLRGQGPGLGGGHDGGMAEYLLVPAARYLIPLGPLDPRQAAPLSDAGLTGYHAVKRSLHLLGPGSTAVVIGASRSCARSVRRPPSSPWTPTPASWRPPSAWAPTRLCSRATRRSPASRT